MIFANQFIALLCCLATMHADTITVHNTTKEDVYVAIYRIDGQIKSRLSKPIVVAASSSANLERPSYRLFTDRALLASTYQEQLLPMLSNEQYQILASTNIGYKYGGTFYITQDAGKIVLRSTVGKFIAPAKKAVSEGIDNATSALLGLADPGYARGKKYEHMQAQMRIGRSVPIPQDEQDYLAKRMPIVQRAIEQFIEEPLSLDETPRIALCGSGGGYRAMIATLGSHIGAQQIGFLDTVTYDAGLSGSTWYIAGWTMRGVSPLEYRDEFIVPLVGHDLFKNDDARTLTASARRKFVLGQPISAVDIYGDLLSLRLLKGIRNNPLNVVLTMQQDYISDGRWPFPIYTAILTGTPYEWVEFTPYEIGSEYLGGFIPTWGFGRKFAQGTSLTYDPEQSLGFLMGIWGSAFTLNAREMYEQAKDSIGDPLIRAALNNSTRNNENIGGLRFSPAVVWNFSSGVATSQRRNAKDITLIDAGLDYNLPVPPLMRPSRDIDIIIMLDASKGLRQSNQMALVVAYMQSRGIPFPAVDVAHVLDDVCTIYYPEEGLNAPIVIYMPLIKNAEYRNAAGQEFDPEITTAGGYSDTFNFKYSPEQVRELSGATAYTFATSIEKLKEAVRTAIAMKRKKLGRAVPRPVVAGPSYEQEPPSYTEATGMPSTPPPSYEEVMGMNEG